ncbi:MAG: choice-of-anchor J domain-containing protein [Bacteroidia bacterium]|nr:choice-of-anchor J domain-containing protein [Bacteroidia bacterium]NNJ82359.1 hypothetical protein [Flavobacteriaceae bacterium]
MKRSNPLHPFIILFILVFACVADDEYEVPVIDDAQVTITGSEISIISLKQALIQEMQTNGNQVLTIETDLYVTGYVISSDEQGNFFEEIMIQDEPADPNAGLRIKIDSNPLFQSYEIGRKVFVKLSGLTVGIDNGQLTIGLRDGNRIGHLSESRMFDFVARDTIVAVIEALPRLISELNEDMLNTYIRLNDVQFNRDLVLGDRPLTYAGEPGDQFDGERTLESCTENATIILSTSTFADFKSQELAPGKGTIEGIFTYNFFGDEFNIVVNNLSSVQLDSPDRCDPLEVDCGIASNPGNIILFSEFFETMVEGEPINGNGWTNFIESGTETWEAFFDDGANGSLGISARMGAYMSGDDSNIGWLITPEINFDQQENEVLSFKTSNSFADGSNLELLFSPDWDGNPETVVLATWNLLSSAVIVQDDDYFGDWIFSGNIDLSCIEGTGHIAWKYAGSGDPDFDGTYELDEIEISRE